MLYAIQKHLKFKALILYLFIYLLIDCVCVVA